MRPLQLTMTAFGPYATQQVIDFRELKGKNLFLINGDTGAGKTTILDGISYALYGKASGRDRDGETLRSHFAAEDVLTTVALEFELQGKQYWVQRSPKQRKKRIRGEGYTDQNAEAEYKCLGEEGSFITGVKEVNEKMVQLMGLSYEQFKQIIMIPQGEFRELLNADSKMRQDILQKIFGTEGFRRIQDQFDHQAKSLAQAVNELINQRNEWIRSLDVSGYEPLAAAIQTKDYNITVVVDEAKRGIAYDLSQGEELKQEIDRYEQQILVKQEEIFQGKNNQLKFSKKEDAQKKKNQLEAYQGIFAEKKHLLEQGRKALGLRGGDDYRKHRKEYVKKKSIELIDSQKQEKKAQLDAQRAEIAYQEQQSKEEERNERLSEKNRLEEFVEKVADWEKGQAFFCQLEKNLAQKQEEQEKQKRKLEVLRSEVEACQARLHQGKIAISEYAVKTMEEEKIQRVYENLKKLQGGCTELLSLEASQLRLEEQRQTQLLQYQKAQSDYEEAQQHFFEGQAGVLASSLRNGQCCPVCGSEEHPKLATLLKTIPTEGQLKKKLSHSKETREFYDEVYARFEQTKAHYHAQYQLFLRMKEEVSEMLAAPLPELNITDLVIDIAGKLSEYELFLRKIQVEMMKLSSEKINEAELVSEISKKNDLVQQMTLALGRTQLQYMELFAQEKSTQDALTVLVAQLPPEVRSIDQLMDKIKKASEDYRRMKEMLEQAEKEHRNRQVDYATANTRTQEIQKALEEGEAEVKKAQQDFMTALEVAGFYTEEEYEKAKLGEGEIANLDQEIHRYQEELRSATDYYLQLQQEVAVLIPVDIKGLEAEKMALEIGKKALHAKHTNLLTRQRHNQLMFAKISASREQLQGLEEEYLLIGHLAKVAKGDNEQKLSFERYVLAAFFNDIIDAANGRLKKMTSGRYQMSRITQKGKGSGQSGLEIEVFDYYTGQSRHVKTLSGGESFKASLALALGLAEVVQAYAGGISLETMFVDEGFGTLDPESLDTAIQCLIELQHSGRLVGIISHVPELKDSIEARLEIKADKNGSRAQFCIM